MDKRELLLTALSAGGQAEHSPVQVQKLIFLIEKNVADRLGGHTYDFAPYDYGPFDSSIYTELRKLKAEGLVASTPTARGWETHQLTEAGLEKGQALAATADPSAIAYVKQVSEVVRKLPFAELVSAVYEAYPEMKVNSVFRG